MIILVDFIARVGNKREEWREVIRGCGEEARNDNGRKLLEFCATNGLIVCNTWYQHKEIHQFTWECRGREELMHRNLNFMATSEKHTVDKKTCKQYSTILCQV